MSRALVTGCAGFIGSHLVEALLARGETVVGIDAFTDFYDLGRKRANLRGFLGNPDFSLVEMNLLERNELTQHLEQVDIVYHLAARAGVRSSWGRTFDDYLSENLAASQRLLEACIGRPLSRVVYASSSSVYGITPDRPARETSPLCPVSPYGVTKLAAEKLFDAYREEQGIPTVSLRLFTVFGPRQRPDMAFDRFLRAAYTGRPITVYGDGSQVRNFTYVSDVVAAFLLAGEKDTESKVFNIGGGGTAILRDVIDHIGEVVGKPLNLKFEAKAPGDVATTDADTARAHAELGFVPQVDWREGIRRQAEWVAGNLTS